MPRASWEFDESVTAVFDDMLARSIPEIGAMRQSVFQVASHLVQPDTHVVDLGCALGASIAPLIDRFGDANRYLGIEASAPMATACRDRLRSFIDADLVEIRNDDLRNGYPEVEASVTLSVLTLMFLPIEHRFRILADAFRHTTPGGALILVEKILGSDSMMDGLFVDLYHRYKEAMGFTREEIDRKRLALEGVLVPVTAGWNEQMFLRSGFAHVECFWRCLNFCGWVAVKAT
jgi:tRNA (cmo5U34)-methyltransferase